MAGNLFWDKMVLGLHCDGTNGSTTFTDVKGKAVTANGNAQISTAQSKFGGSSGHVDGTGDYLSLTGESIGTGDFYVAGWVRVTTPTSSFILLDTRNSDATNNGFALYIRSTQKLTFGRGNPFTATEGATTVSANTWYYVELSRVSGTVYGFLDGNLEFSVSSSLDFNLTGWKIGHQWNVSGSLSAGYIDDLQVYRAGGHTSAYTVPSVAFDEGYAPSSGIINLIGNAPTLPVASSARPLVFCAC